MRERLLEIQSAPLDPAGRRQAFEAEYASNVAISAAVVEWLETWKEIVDKDPALYPVFPWRLLYSLPQPEPQSVNYLKPQPWGNSEDA